MPVYTFKNKETGEHFDKQLRIAELDEFKESHPEYEHVIGSPRIVTGMNQKPDSGFRDVLKGIKKANRRSTINTF